MSRLARSYRSSLPLTHKTSLYTQVPGDGWFYGELSWQGMYDLIGLAEPKEGDVFVDMVGLYKLILV